MLFARFGAPFLLAPCGMQSARSLLLAGSQKAQLSLVCLPTTLSVMDCRNNSVRLRFHANVCMSNNNNNLNNVLHREAGGSLTRQRKCNQLSLCTGAAVLLFLCLLTEVKPGGSVKSAPDFAICHAWRNGSFTIQNCKKEPEKNYCCIRELIQFDSKTKWWSKDCCTEKEFVQQNS